MGSKLYAWHAPEVDCISKGKAKQLYEFGVKVGIASTQLKGNLIVGARAFHGNPYSGHTLTEQLEQATILMQDSNAKPATAFVDPGLPGVDGQPDVHIDAPGRNQSGSVSRKESCSGGARLLNHHPGTSRPITAWVALPPRGEQDDRLRAVLCATGYNVKWLLHDRQEGVYLPPQPFCYCLQQASTQGRSWLAAVMKHALLGC